MEFYVVVLIFVVCMIVLALLIYYCQEYRNNAKYSFTENQRDITAIALAIGVPAFNTNPSTGYKPSGIVPFIVTPRTPSPPLGFVINGTHQPINQNVSPYPTKSPPPQSSSSKDYPYPPFIPDDEMSDSGSSSSSKIYYNPKTTAYSIAKRMSFSNTNTEAIARRKSLQYAISTQATAYLLAKKWRDMHHNDRSSSPAVSENAHHSDRGNSQDPCGIDMKHRRSMSPYLPTSVVSYQLRNNDSRNTPLRSDSPIFLIENERVRCNNEIVLDGNTIVVPPKRTKKRNASIQDDYLDSKQKELAPPQCSENISYPRQNHVFDTTKTNEDHLDPVREEASYRSPSPAPLQTVEEEE